MNLTTYSPNSDRHIVASEWNDLTRTINTIDQNNLISKIKFVRSLKEHNYQPI